MLDSNGFISNGELQLFDDELQDTVVKKTSISTKIINKVFNQLNKYSALEAGADIYKQILELKADRNRRIDLTAEEKQTIDDKLANLKYEKTELFNLKQTYDPKNEKQLIADAKAKLRDYTKQIKELEAKEKEIIKKHKADLKADVQYNNSYNEKLSSLEKDYNIIVEKRRKEIFELGQSFHPVRAQINELEKKSLELSERYEKLSDKESHEAHALKAEIDKLDVQMKELIATINTEKYNILSRNLKLAKEVYLSIGRYGLSSKIKLSFKLIKALKKAMQLGVDLSDENQVNKVFDEVVFRVAYKDETPYVTHGYCNLDLAKVKYTKDWQQIRGTRVATIFQDPMTSLNPIITIGKQITSIIIKHQHCSPNEARLRAIELMKKVGIPNAEKRFDDYPFQYSGGMRHRIVIAIALSCQPKILVCDEPTTALDVTIQAQILKLIKDLQKEFKYTIVFITHDLGVVANIADRVAVIYAGQIVELGTCEEVFYDPRHPYTWALLSSLPQLADRGTELYSISGTPPSLYNKIVGDPFAPRNPYCLKIDTFKDSPMFKVTDTHYAKTWLLDPRSPKIDKPEIIQDIHNKLIKVFNI